MWTLSRAGPGRASPESELGWQLALGLSASRTVSNNFLLLKPPGYGTLLWWPKVTKAIITTTFFAKFTGSNILHVALYIQTFFDITFDSNLRQLGSSTFL